MRGLVVAVGLVLIGLAAREVAEPDLAATATATRSAPGTVEVDLAIERGLRWLAQSQAASGGWTGDVGHKRQDDYFVYGSAAEQTSSGHAHVGVTALAGLAFLAAGYVPEQGPFAPVLDRTLAYLIRCRDAYDYVTDAGTNMYSHAFAVLFLAQVHGMSRARGAEIHESLRRGVSFIERAQNRHGAWRYAPYTDEADLSVTVCQVQALRAARVAGIRVNRAVIDRVVEYVRESRIERGSLAGAFYYKIHGRAARTKTSFAINAAAVTSLHAAGLYDEREYGRALLYVEDGYEEISRYYPTHFYFWYGNYYAAQALHYEGGERFTRYWNRLARDLVQRQQSDGRWVNDCGPGDAFATAVACLLLAMPREYLPIFHR